MRTTHSLLAPEPAGRESTYVPATRGAVLNLAPWIAVAPVGEDPNPDSLTGYSQALVDAIGERARTLAEQAIADRPHWMAYLG
ncbi:hypothetical protein [Glycomyces rhizosphaerae]|uniref:Uncharacterized protein n=1 Tax=Glycomyces rhizosphaerae TaxID=2054422 RepID=A0ABV7PUA4_9ACTN